MSNDTDQWAAAGSAALQQDRAQQIRNNMLATSGKNPDQAANYQHLAAYVQVPVESVEQDPEGIKAQAQARRVDADALATDAPRTAAYLADPLNAAKSHDDVHNLAGLEGVVKALPAPRKLPPQYGNQTAVALPEHTPTIRDRIGDWWQGLVGGPTAEQQRQAQGAAEANAILAGRAAHPELVPKPGATPAEIDALNNQAWEASRQAIGGMSQTGQIAAEKFLNSASLGIISPTVPMRSHSWQASTAGAAGSLAGFIVGPAKIAGGIVGAVPGAARLAPVAGEAWLTGLAKSMAMQSATLGLASALQESGGAVLDSQSVAEGAARVVKATAAGAAIGGTFGAAGKLLPDNTIAQWLARAIGVSAAQDVITGVNPLDDRPLEDKLFGYGMNAIFTMHGAGRTTGNWFTDHPEVRQAYADAERAQTAEQGIQAIQALGEMATASKTRERDPAAFRQLVQDMTENGQLTDVYVSAKDLGDVLNQSGVTVEQLADRMPEVAGQIREALATNGDVRIPVEDYATHIAGGPVDAVLLPHLKTDADGMTFKEAQDHFTTQQESMAVQAAKINTDLVAVDAKRADSQEVHDAVLAQLDALKRFNPETNKSYATLMRAFFETQGARSGMTAKEAYDLSGLRIKGQSPIDALHQENRGAFDPATSTLALLKAADLSTFLHETGHFFLEASLNMAARPGVPESMRADAQTLLAHLGHEGLALPEWQAKTVEEKRAAHEKFAVGFEKYLMEGRAPTIELQSLFSRFRSWLVNVYKSLTNLGVKLEPEVRAIMDRMLASDQAIHEAEQTRKYKLLFDTAESAASSRELFEKYEGLGQRATDEAIADMTGRSMRDLKWSSDAKAKAIKALQKEAADQRSIIRDQVAKEVAAQPYEQARAYLKSGKLFDADGKELPDARELGAPAAKLDAEILKTMYPKDVLGNPDLSKLRGLTGKNGLHPDIVAEMFGILDGHELVRQLTEAPPAKEVIKELTDQRMLEQHGELTDQQHIEQAANEAVHNETRARFIATGLKILSKSPIPARQLVKAAREAAEASVAGKRVRDLRPAQYLAAEARANTEALKLAPTDPAGAVQAQRAALLNNQLFRAADAAVRDVQKQLKYLGKFEKESVRAKIDLEYREQIDALLDRHDLRKSVSGTALDKRASLNDFVERMAAAGFEPNVPERLLNEAQRTHYKDMTIEQFAGLVDAVRSIDHLGRLKTELLDGKEKRDIAALADEAAATMAQLPQREAESNRGLTRIGQQWMNIKAGGRSLQASLLKMEQMLDWLDGRNTNGVMNRVVFRRVADAGVKEYDLQKQVKAGIDQLMHDHLHDVTKDGGKIYTAERLIDGLTGKAQRFTKKEMLALAGNMGNESNLAKLAAGEKWDPQNVWDFLHANMTKADWDFVAGLGWTLESLWPEKLAMSRRLGNSNPEKIAPRAFDTPHGRYEGWYWPMIYDPARAQDVAERGAKAGDSMFENTYARANTDTGRGNTRVEGYARPLLLSLDVIPRVIKDEIHDIAYREAIMDTDKFLRTPKVRDSIVSALSQEHYDQLRPWLQSIANDRKVDMQALKWFDKLAHGARTRATIVGLGYRLSTMLVHGSSAALESIAEVGPVWMAKGLADFANPVQWSANKAFIFERSGEMANRMNEVDRDVREHLREIDVRLMDTTTGAIARGADTLKARAYQGIAMLDMASALPTWMGAYHKAMAPESAGGKGLSEADAIYYADKTVRNAHGGSGIKDQAAIQRGPEFLKLFTMFYTFWNHNVNRLMDTARRAGELPQTYREGAPGQFRGDLGTVVMRTLIYTLGIQAMHGMLHPKKDGDEETSWAAWAAKEMAASAFAGIPVLRDISAHFLTGKDYSATPAASMVDAVGHTGMDAANLMAGEEANSKWLKHSITTAGYVYGLPLGQPASTVQFLWDVEQGNANPEDISDWWRGIVHGDMKKH